MEEQGFGLVQEKYMSGRSEWELEERTVKTKIVRAYKQLVRGWWDCLAELGWDRGI
jgi:hypothetical protein